MKRPDPWSADELAWLRETYPTRHNAELPALHDAACPVAPHRTEKAIASRAKLLGVVKAEGFVRNPPRMWTDEKVAWLRSFVPGHTEAEISAEHEQLYGFPLSAGQIGNAKTKFGLKSCTHGGRFEPGHEPANKGKTWDEFMSPEGQERSRATQFRKGEVQGFAASRMQPIGSERVDAKDGYVWVKVAEGLQDRPNGNFRLKHHVVYERAHGAIPPGCNVVFADRDRRNFDPSNLVAVPRRLWSVIVHEGWAYHDAESLRACMALAELSKAVYRARCHPRRCRSCGAEFAPRYPHQRTCDKCLGR